MGSRIGYTDFAGKTVDLPMGRDHGVTREGACLDICLARAVAFDFPLVAFILIRTDGRVVLWSVEFQSGADNACWHFSAGSDASKRPTDGQLATLERMFLGFAELPGGLGTALGWPVAEWAFAGQTLDGVADKHGAAPPVMG